MAKKRKLNINKHNNSSAPFMENHDGSSSQESNHIDDDHQQVEHMTTEQEVEIGHQQEMDLGTYLRQNRESKGLTVQHISHVTKISSKNIQNLESNKLKQLPDKIYVAGYVKNYAKILSLDTQACLDLLEKEYSKLIPHNFSTATTQKPVPAPRQPLSQEDKQKLVLWGSVAGAAVIVITLIVTVFSSNSSSSPDKNQIASSPKKQEAKKEEIVTAKEITTQSLNSETPLQEELPVEEVKQEAKQEVANKEKVDKKQSEPKVETKEPEKVVEQVAEKKPAKKIAKLEEEKVQEKKEEVPSKPKFKRFYPISTPLYSAKEVSDEESFAALAPQDVKDQFDAKLQNIFIVARGGSCWVTYKTDKGRIKQRYLKDGKHISFKGKEVRVAIGHVSVAKIYLNKEPILVESKTGVKNMVFPQENAIKYKMPLFVYNKEKNSFRTAEDYIKVMAPAPKKPVIN